MVFLRIIFHFLEMGFFVSTEVWAIGFSFLNGGCSYL